MFSDTIHTATTLLDFEYKAAIQVPSRILRQLAHLFFHLEVGHNLPIPNYAGIPVGIGLNDCFVIVMSLWCA